MDEQVRNRLDRLHRQYAFVRDECDGVVRSMWRMDDVAWLLAELERALVVVDAAIAWRDFQEGPGDYLEARVDDYKGGL